MKAKKLQFRKVTLAQLAGHEQKLVMGGNKPTMDALCTTLPPTNLLSLCKCYSKIIC